MPVLRSQLLWSIDQLLRLQLLNIDIYVHIKFRLIVHYILIHIIHIVLCLYYLLLFFFFLLLLFCVQGYLYRFQFLPK